MTLAPYKRPKPVKSKLKRVLIKLHLIKQPFRLYTRRGYVLTTNMIGQPIQVPREEAEKAKYYGEDNNLWPSSISTKEPK